MPKTLTERLQDDENNILDRRQISTDSRKQLAEYIENDNFKDAFQYLFHIIVGDEISEYPPTRDVTGEVIASDSAIEELDGLKLRVVTQMDNEERQSVVSDSSSRYIFRNIKEGEYEISSSNQSGVVYEYGEDDMEKIEYEIKSIDISIEYDSVEVDTTQVEFGEDVVGPDVIIESIEIGDKL